MSMLIAVIPGSHTGIIGIIGIIGTLITGITELRFMCMGAQVAVVVTMAPLIAAAGTTDLQQLQHA